MANATRFTAAQSKMFKELLMSIHPDRVEEAKKIKATWLTQKANAAKDKGHWAPIQDLLDALVNGTIWDEPEQAKPEPETKKEKAKKTFTLDPIVLRSLQEQVEAGQWPRSKAGNWLGFTYDMKPAEVKAYLDEVFKEAPKGSRTSVKAQLFDRLTAGPMGKEEFEDWIKGQSDNTIKHRSVYELMVEFANAIHAKYAK